MDRHETAISAAIRDVVIFVVDNLYNRNEVKKKKDKCVFWLYDLNANMSCLTLLLNNYLGTFGVNKATFDLTYIELLSRYEAGHPPVCSTVDK